MNIGKCMEVLVIAHLRQEKDNPISCSFTSSCRLTTSCVLTLAPILALQQGYNRANKIQAGAGYSKAFKFNLSLSCSRNCS